MKAFMWILISMVGMAGALAACKPAPNSADASSPSAGVAERLGTAINFGTDTCTYNPGHTIVRVRHGAEIVEKSGAVHKFCSTECMIKYHLEGHVAEEDVANWLVVDFAKSRELLDAKDALFINTKLLPSPGGMGISALRDEEIARTTHFAYAGEIVGWEEIVEVVREATVEP